jgi:hypothetical protein
MTDLPSSAPAARRPPQRRGRTVFLAACLPVFVLVAAGLRFLGPRSAPPGVTMADLWPAGWCRTAVRYASALSTLRRPSRVLSKLAYLAVCRSIQLLATLARGDARQRP